MVQTVEDGDGCVQCLLSVFQPKSRKKPQRGKGKAGDGRATGMGGRYSVLGSLGSSLGSKVGSMAMASLEQLWSV